MPGALRRSARRRLYISARHRPVPSWRSGRVFVCRRHRADEPPETHSQRRPRAGAPKRPHSIRGFAVDSRRDIRRVPGNLASRPPPEHAQRGQRDEDKGEQQRLVVPRNAVKAMEAQLGRHEHGVVVGQVLGRRGTFEPAIMRALPVNPAFQCPWKRCPSMRIGQALASGERGRPARAPWWTDSTVRAGQAAGGRPGGPRDAAPNAIARSKLRDRATAPKTLSS